MSRLRFPLVLRSRWIRSFAGVAALSLLCLAGTGNKAHATIIVTLSDAGGNFNNVNFPPNYGTITIDLVDSNTINVTITADPGSHNGHYYLFGDGGTVGLNLTGSGFSVSNIVATSPVTNTPNAQQGNAGNLDGFGSFSFQMNSLNGQGGQGGAGDALSSLSFTVTASGNPWANEASILTATDKGKLAAGHLFVYDNVPSLTFHDANFTDYVANGDVRITQHSPEPATVVTLLTGLPFGVVALRRRLRRVAARSA